jgi:hypothetical protein
MFIRLAMKLKIRFQVCLVSAKLADIMTGYHSKNFLFSDLGPVCRQVVRKGF